MSPSKPSTLEWIGVPVVAVAAPGLLLTCAVWVVNALPRLAQGEPVRASWPLCVLVSVSVAIWLPWFAFAPWLRHLGSRITLLIFLLLATYGLYFFGFADVLSKAYRRGL